MDEPTDAPSSGAPPAAEGGDPSPQPTDQPGDAPNTGPSLEQRISKGVQAMTDQNLAYFRTGRFEEMHPKMLEFASVIQNSLQARSGDAPATPAPVAPPQSMPTSTPVQVPVKPDGTKDYEAIGKAADLERISSQAQEIIGSQWLERLWDADVREFVGTAGKIPMTDEQWASVDFTDRNAFPLSIEGYRKWRGNAEKLSRELAEAQSKDSGDAPDQVDVDRQMGSGQRPPPNPQGNKGAPIKSLHDASVAFREGRISKDEFKAARKRYTSIHY